MRSLVLVCLTACSFRAGVAGGDGGHDGPIGSRDSGPTNDTFQCTVSFSSLFDACSAGFGGDLTLSGRCYRYNTDTHVLEDRDCQDNNFTTTATPLAWKADNNGVDVLLVSSFTVSSDLDIVGSAPFEIASTGPVVIQSGTVTVEAGRRSAAVCGARAGTNGTPNPGGGGGGGGAAFQQAGLVGGNGGSGNGGGGGAAIGIPTKPTGGCPGGSGGGGSPPGDANGGAGGGAIYIASASSITVDGTINAGGKGGTGGLGNSNNTGTGYVCGGGGGGSGGMIWLESKLIGITGAIAANGGSGGEGSGTALPGKNGNSGLPTGAKAPGGGNADPNGGDGGDGGARAGLPTAGQTKSGGGGGGGGGTGYIKLSVTHTGGGVVSPPAS